MHPGMRLPIHHLLFACALAIPLFTVAQTGVVKGFVYEQATGDPSIFTPVCLVGTSFCATTDVQGYFCMSKLPPGRYTLRIVYLGYDTLARMVDVRADEITTLKLYLKERTDMPPYVNMPICRPPDHEREVRLSVQRLTPKDLERVPPIGQMDEAVRSTLLQYSHERNSDVSSLTSPKTGVQRPTIAFLLSMADCLDSACVSERARTIHYCFMGGGQEDGWNWFSCDYSRTDSISDFWRLVTLGFFGYSWSNYRDYIIVTGDTAAADTLTAELLGLGFKVDGPHPEGQLYRSSAYPGLDLQRLEKRHYSVKHRKKEEPTHPRALTMEEAGRERWQDVAKSMKESGYDSFDIIPHLMWVFKVRVHTPR